MTVAARGRSCPISYRLRPEDLALPATCSATTLYVVGGLYGSVAALDAVLARVAQDAPAVVVFNGDFHYLDVAEEDFRRIADGVSGHLATRGNVETELATAGDDAGCGCGYPDYVDDGTVDASEHDLRRLAASVLEYVRHVPALAGALDLSVREAVAARLMLVPGVADPPASKTISWVTATMGPQRNGPPAIVAAAGELSMTARQVAPAVRQAGEDLVRHAASAPSVAQQATVVARRHAGEARGELRRALADRGASQPAALAAMAAHARSAAPPRATSPRR